MVLTPSTEDSNRRSELARKKKDPNSFGPSKLETPPKEWVPANQRKTKSK